MPQALVINPNTSITMSANIRIAAEKVFDSPWSCRVVNAPAGPESLESWRDYSFASVAVIPLLSEYQNVDGIVLACFGDPGLYALKEVSHVPVVGIAEASISMSLLIGGRFGILVGMSRAVQLMDTMVRNYRLEERYTGTRSLDMRVLCFEEEYERTIAGLEQVGKVLVEQGADVILLGCAGLSSFVDELTAKLHVPVIDPVDAGCRMLKAIVESGLNISHAGVYALPARQRMNNLDQFFNREVLDTFSNWEKE
jgi:allantoin racemase